MCSGSRVRTDPACDVNPGPSDERQPLSDVRVIAIEQAVAAPLCTRHLADLGADVIKVERPDGGDFARAYDTIAHGESAYFVWLNYGKRSVTIDLGSVAGQDRLANLLGSADVLVHNLGPGAMGRLGFDPETIATRWPSLIACSISGYGSDGPYRDRKAFDLLLQGESGLAATTGTPAQPAKVGISVADIAAGMYALSGILAALRRRDRTGAGERIEISMLECLAEWLAVPALYQRYGGAAPKRSGLEHATIAPYGPYACADGTVNLAVQNRGQWERLCRQVLDSSHLVDDPRFATNESRVHNRDALAGLIASVLGSLPVAEIRDRLTRADVPFGDVNDIAGLLAHAQLAARDRWWDVATPSGPIRVARPPFGMTGLRSTLRAVPALGQHDDEVDR